MSDPYLAYNSYGAAPVSMYSGPSPPPTTFTPPPVTFNPQPATFAPHTSAGFNQAMGQRPTFGTHFPSAIRMTTVSGYPVLGQPDMQPSVPVYPSAVRMQVPNNTMPSFHTVPGANVGVSHGFVNSSGSTRVSTTHPARVAYTQIQHEHSAMNTTKSSQQSSVGLTEMQQSLLGQQTSIMGTEQLWNQGKSAFAQAQAGPPSLTASVPEFIPRTPVRAVPVAEENSSDLNPHTPDFVPGFFQPHQFTAPPPHLLQPNTMTAPPPGLQQAPGPHSSGPHSSGPHPSRPHSWSMGGYEENSIAETTQTEVLLLNQSCQAKPQSSEQESQTSLEGGDLANLCSGCKLKLGLSTAGQSSNSYFIKAKNISAEHKTKFISCQASTLLRDSLDLLADPAELKVKLRRKLTFMCQQFGAKPSAQSDWEDDIICSVAVSILTDMSELALAENSPRFFRQLSDEVWSHLEIAHDLMTEEQQENQNNTTNGPSTDAPSASSSQSRVSHRTSTPSSILPSDSFLDNHVTGIISDSNHLNSESDLNNHVAASNQPQGNMGSLPLLLPPMPGFNFGQLNGQAQHIGIPSSLTNSVPSMPQNLGLSTGWPLMADPLNPDLLGQQGGLPKVDRSLLDFQKQSELMKMMQLQQQQLQQMLLMKSQVESLGSQPGMPGMDMNGAALSSSSLETTDAKLKKIFASAQKEVSKASVSFDETDNESVYSVESNSTMRSQPGQQTAAVSDLSKPHVKPVKKSFVGKRAPPLDLRSRHKSTESSKSNETATPKEDFSAAFLRQINANMVQTADTESEDMKIKKHMTPLQRKRLLKLQQQQEGSSHLEEFENSDENIAAQLESLKYPPQEFKVPAAPVISQAANLHSAPCPTPVVSSSLPPSNLPHPHPHHSNGGTHPPASEVRPESRDSFSTSGLQHRSRTSSHSSEGVTPTQHRLNGLPSAPGPKSFFTDLDSMYQQKRQSRESSLRDSMSPSPSHSQTDQQQQKLGGEHSSTQQLGYDRQSSGYDSGKSDRVPVGHSVVTASVKNSNGGLDDSFNWPTLSNDKGGLKQHSAVHETYQYQNDVDRHFEQNGFDVHEVPDSNMNSEISENNFQNGFNDDQKNSHANYHSNIAPEHEQYDASPFKYIDMQNARQYSMDPQATKDQYADSNGVSNVGPRFSKQLADQPKKSVRNYDPWEDSSDARSRRENNYTKSNVSNGDKRSIKPTSGETKYRNDKLKSLDTLDDISLDPKELIKLKASKQKKSGEEEESEEWKVVSSGKRKGSTEGVGVKMTDEMYEKLEEFKASEKCGNLTKKILTHFPALTQLEASRSLELVFECTKGLAGMRQPSILEEVNMAVASMFPSKAGKRVFDSKSAKYIPM